MLPSVLPLANVTVFKEEHDLKAVLPMEVTFDDMVTDFKVAHPLKALAGMEVSVISTSPDTSGVIKHCPANTQEKLASASSN